MAGLSQPQDPTSRNQNIQKRNLRVVRVSREIGEKKKGADPEEYVKKTTDGPRRFHEIRVERQDLEGRAGGSGSTSRSPPLAGPSGIRPRPGFS